MKTPVASRALDSRSAVITDLHKHSVGERAFGVELVRPPCRQRAADRAAVADDERRQRAVRDVGEGGLDALCVFLARLAAGEAEAVRAGFDRERAGPGVRVLALDVGDQAPLPFASPRLREALVHDPLEADLGADDLGGLARAGEVARVKSLEGEPLRLLGERARL